MLHNYIQIYIVPRGICFVDQTHLFNVRNSPSQVLYDWYVCVSVCVRVFLILVLVLISTCMYLNNLSQ